MVIDIYTDGGSSGNPGRAACAYAIYLHNEVFYKHAEGLGLGTNNFAEYSALIRALEKVVSLIQSDLLQGLSKIHVFSDSELMVKQVTGLYKIKNDMIKIYAAKVKELERIIAVPVTYTHIPREKNKLADSLVRSILY